MSYELHRGQLYCITECIGRKIGIVSVKKYVYQKLHNYEYLACFFYLQMTNNNLNENHFVHFVHELPAEEGHIAEADQIAAKCIADMKLLSFIAVDALTGCNKITYNALVCIENMYYKLHQSN